MRRCCEDEATVGARTTRRCCEEATAGTKQPSQLAHEAITAFEDRGSGAAGALGERTCAAATKNGEWGAAAVDVAAEAAVVLAEVAGAGAVAGAVAVATPIVQPAT